MLINGVNNVYVKKIANPGFLYMRSSYKKVSQTSILTNESNV